MNIDMITAAAQRIKGHARKTPLLSSVHLDKIAGRRVWVKPECLQVTGSFKFRGAWSAISALNPTVAAKGVLAFSSGNHAQGIAHAATLHGIPSVIIMPSDAPSAKINGTSALGGEVVLYDRSGESREEIGARLSQERQLTLIRPYDDPLVLAGQGTCGLEIAQQAGDLGITAADVLVCCGGGGLTAGVALALEAKAQNMKVYPVEPEGFDDMARSQKSGKRETNAITSGGLCDAILTPKPGELTFPIIQRLCAPGVVVTEEEALRAMALAFKHLKVVAEPGGAVALAAALFHGDALKQDAAICTISGGNLDSAVMQRALELDVAQ